MTKVKVIEQFNSKTKGFIVIDLNQFIGLVVYA